MSPSRLLSLGAAGVWLPPVISRDGPDGAGAYARRLPARDHFPEYEGRQNHGQDGGDSRDDGGIRRGGETHAYGKGHLVEDDSEQGGVKQVQTVARVDFFPGHEAGSQPEQHGGAQQPERSQGGGAYFSSLHDQLADRGHEPPDDGRRSHGGVSLQGSGFHLGVPRLRGRYCPPPGKECKSFYRIPCGALVPFMQCGERRSGMRRSLVPGVTASAWKC